MKRKMRVIAGRARSLSLVVPGGVAIRPTTDAMRESLFASLGSALEGANFADLYAGSGAVGIEALSRGARQAVFVENNPRCLEDIKVNLENTNLARQAVVVSGQVLKRWLHIAAQHGPFDIVFVDPPYRSADLSTIGRRLIVQGQGMADQGLVIVQHDRSEPLVTSCSPEQTKLFGQTQIDLFTVDSDTQKENGSE